MKKRSSYEYICNLKAIEIYKVVIARRLSRFLNNFYYPRK